MHELTVSPALALTLKRRFLHTPCSIAVRRMQALVSLDFWAMKLYVWPYSISRNIPLVAVLIRSAGGEAVVHFLEEILHLVFPDCLVVTETTGIEVLAVFFLFERICGDF